MVLKLLGFKQAERAKPKAVAPAKAGRPTPKARPTPVYEPAEHIVLEEDPVQRHMQLERFGSVVRHRERWKDHPLIEAAFQAAVEEIDRTFAIVPEGFVSLAMTTTDFPGAAEEDVETEPFLLARCCVTNRQYQLFVDSGGYADLDLWPADVWPHLINFKDQTEQPGPRFWRDGVHDQRLADHPVVGICYYEAAAFAHWAGYRLPTGAEWQMAASWRIRSSAHVLRRYPWGDALDTSRCNIWASNVGGTTPVDAYPTGAAPNGALQLIGNVWEWADSDYFVTDDSGRMVVGDMLLKEIRGGAYDTYFPAQATSCFRTGLPSLARVHNVGFRCVVDLSNTSPAPAEGDRK
ncbi:MAG: SUMF1/EgtB/PvdO family nonheme iron enzyme [Phycisphaerae bacterium]|nr:SUMF1/EgtB/PvdO family nonheme iron enzyme [Phycisphaerae bacterium]